jgi:hypothetical protein
VVDGCGFHALSAGSVGSRWASIEALDEACAMCACCLGPCRVGADFCTRCAQLTPVQVRYLELLPVVAS